MSIPIPLVVIVGLLAVDLGGGESSRLVSAQSTCVASPRQDWLPKVIAPSAGESPIWFVGDFGQWQGPGVPMKSVWIVDRKVTGALRVKGRQLQTNEALLFRVGMEGPIVPSLVIEAPAADSVTPGGASAEVMRQFAFVMSYVFYPSPGCWELEAQLGAQTRKLVLRLD